MVSDSPKDVAGSATCGIKAGNVDEELKKVYNDMKRRVSEVPAYIRFLKNGEESLKAVGNRVYDYEKCLPVP